MREQVHTMKGRAGARVPMATLCAAALALILPAAHAQSAPGAYTLHYDKPASTWTEALPVGNGRLGAMVFGNVGDELLQLNEATLWSGGPVSPNVNPGAFQYLAQVRAVLAAGDYEAASELLRKMQGHYTEGYLPLADLKIHQDVGQASDYYRDLNIRDGVATTTFAANGVRYKREVFASAPGEVIVVRLSADKPKQISLDIDASSQLRFANTLEGDAIVMHGKAPAHVDPSYYHAEREPVVYDDPTHCRGMRFETIVAPQVKDGTLTASGGKIHISGASEVVLLVSAATSFAGFDQCPDRAGKDEDRLAHAHLEHAGGKDYAALLAEHVADMHKYFDRVDLSLNPGAPDKSAVATDRRLEAYFHGQSDPQLETLFFQYGRYLLMSSSRTKDAPANLQGIWNKDVRPPWSSNYTTNINLQMNYWPVEAANLSEMFAPLDDLIRHLTVTGSETARSFYHLPGWVVHHNSDIWAASNPVGEFGAGNPMWANWYMGAAWLSRHMWEHYQFTGDKAYLKSAYPVMKGAAQFMLGWLQKDGQGHLVTMPSTSPENVYYYDGGKKGTVTVGSTMDMGVIRDLFANLESASEVLGTDAAFRQTLQATSKQLLPFQVGSRGQLQEWYKDFQDVDPHHRHTSQLYALHPAHEISPLRTPALADAARRTLELRGDDGTGWSLAWKVNMWTRLLDGNHAYKLFRNELRLTKDNDKAWGGHGGAYPNLFDAHPPFQIDGNFAGTAGVIEMLLQSQNDELHLLPALPDAWDSGSVRGLVGRGGFVVDMAWRDHKLASATVLAREGGRCVIRTAGPVRVEGIKQSSRKSTIGYTLSFKARKGTRYRLVPV
jgi:alpha-L-fucosidase 2